MLREALARPLPRPPAGSAPARHGVVIASSHAGPATCATPTLRSGRDGQRAGAETLAHRAIRPKSSTTAETARSARFAHGVLPPQDSEPKKSVRRLLNGTEPFSGRRRGHRCQDALSQGCHEPSSGLTPPSVLSRSFNPELLTFGPTRSHHAATVLVQALNGHPRRGAGDVLGGEEPVTSC